MLPILTLSAVDGLVYLNGMFCGEACEVSLPLSMRGTHYLELRPFDAQARGAVLRLRTENGLLVGGVTGDAYAVQWPDGRIALEIRGQETPDVPAPPRLLAQTEDVLLVAEGGAASFGRNADEAVFFAGESAAERVAAAACGAGAFRSRGRLQ